MTNDPIIKIEQLEKSFGDLHVLKGINLEVDRGEVVCIIGASGSGKSTLLRCINLLEEADSGHIWFDGQDLMDLKVDLNALRQKIGERAAEFLLREKRGELLPAHIVRGEFKARVLYLRRAEVVAENGLTLCDVRFAERFKRHRPRVNERGENEKCKDAKGEKPFFLHGRPP